MNLVHMDRIEARKSKFEKKIDYGTLVAGFASNVIAMKTPGPGTVYLEQVNRFEKPACLGGTVMASVEVSEIVNDGMNILKLSKDVENQHGEVAVSGHAVVKAP